MASMAEEFGQSTSSFDGTQVFTPQYAYDHEDEEDDELEGGDAPPHPHQPAHYEFAEDGLDEEDGEGDELEQLDDEQLVEESQRDHQDSDIVQSSKSDSKNTGAHSALAPSIWLSFPCLFERIRMLTWKIVRLG